MLPPLREALELAGDLGFRTVPIEGLWAVAGVAAGQGDAIRAARLSAAAERLNPGSDQTSVLEFGIHVPYLEAARAAADPAAWEAARREGSMKTLDEAIELALTEG